MKQVIVALDFSSFIEVRDFLNQNHEIQYVKIGMELFYSQGEKIVEFCKSKGLKVFLDLKLHDIPTTVSRALRVIADFKVDMVNVHALGGAVMLKEAALSLKNSKTKLLAVTILTSHDQKSTHSLGLLGSIENNVKSLTQMSYHNGVNGVVCSAQDLQSMKLINNFEYVTPGIRLNSSSDDQKRVMKPKEALNAGATYIVMGRELTRSKDSRKTISELIKHLEG